MSKYAELESKDYNNGMTAYELMEANGLFNTAKVVKDAITEHVADNERLKNIIDADPKSIEKDVLERVSVDPNGYVSVVDAARLVAELRASRHALWLMTAEWADAMGLASCNIAIKLSVKERFFYNDEANREKDIKKYRHRQVIFYKYADYCRKKAEEYK